MGDESGTSGTSVSDLDEKVDELTTDEVLEAADAHGTADAPSPEVREATEGHLVPQKKGFNSHRSESYVRKVCEKVL